MPKDIRLWQITGSETLSEISTDKLNLEGRLEAWLEDDVSMISNDLLVIGRQVGTDFGGSIDLLCIDENGDLVVVELKRDKTPRDVAAQALDYGSWIKDLSNDRVTDIAERYLQSKGKGSFEDQFRVKFEAAVPEVLNENHKMMIVATELDPQTERIIEYLSDTYGVGINAMTFQYFKDPDGREIVGRVFLIDPTEVAQKSARRSTAKRQVMLSREELRESAERNGVGLLYDQAETAMLELFYTVSTTKTTIAFSDKLDDQKRVIFSLVPTESSPEDGLKYAVYMRRLAELVGTTPEAISDLLPNLRGSLFSSEIPSWTFGFFTSPESISRFVDTLKSHRSPPLEH